MATQIVSHSPVLQFPQSVPAREVSQDELVSLIEGRNVLAQFKKQVEELESDIQARLDAGATVEPGVHVAELKTSSRRSVAWKDVACRLAVRLKMNGEAYCARVLAATKPSTSISLIVR